VERRHQVRPGLGKFWSGQLTAWQTCSKKVPACSDPVKRWNFCKADWKRFCLLTDESVERLPPLDTTNIEKAKREVCKSPLTAAKQCIPHSRQKNYGPCWDNECKNLYRSFVRAPVGTYTDTAASSWLSQKRQERWKEVVNSTHSSRKVWSTINKLAGRYVGSSRLCPITSQLKEWGTPDCDLWVQQAHQQGAA